MATLQVVLFVEGSNNNSSGRPTALEKIWNTHLVGELNAPPFSRIVGISKKHLVAMDPSNPRMSGNGEGLDLLMERELRRRSFDAAVVAWDLVPSWNVEADCCRWQETLSLYRFLGDSQVLPEAWTSPARSRFAELQARSSPAQRTRPHRIARGEVVAVCMDPMFEGVLVQDEQAVRRALGFEGKERPRDWPTTGWGASGLRSPDRDVLAKVVESLKDIRPKPSVLKQVGANFRTSKTEWGEYLLRKMIEDDRSREDILDHPLLRRLKECLQ